MNTTRLTGSMREARKAQQEAHQRHKRNEELMKLFSGGALVLTGLLLAAIYGLLTHQVPA